MTTERHAREILAQGYTVIERTHDGEEVAALRDAVVGIYESHGAPTPYADPARELSSEVLVNPTGFVIFKLLALRPDLAQILLSERLVRVARAALGDDMHLELTGAVLSDPRRPFFSWHNHIGGIDVEDYRARGVFPRFTTSERLIAVLYLDDIDTEGGEILVLPRRIDEPTEPPFDQRSESWEGQVPVHFPGGSTLVLEQCTWHAVRPAIRDVRRIFVGCYLTSQAAPPTDAKDDSLMGFRGGGSLLQSVLPR